MYDTMEPLVQFSPLAGQLVREVVPGAAAHKIEFENEVRTVDGADRTMWCYAPRSGCPDAKQTQVLFVLREKRDEDSARRLLDELGLIQLAEQQHFLLLLPDPDESGWGVDREGDMAFLSRCFASLRGSRLRVNGFNGMLFYLAVGQTSSALLADTIAMHPETVAAAMLDQLPEGYTLPPNALGIETSAWCRPGVMAEYLRTANGGQTTANEPGVQRILCAKPEVRLFLSDRPVDRECVQTAWQELFAPTRRWQNDTFGHYQRRTDFTARGFVAHYKDTSLGINNGGPHTWYEYVPPRLRGSSKKVPLVFFFHGINCVPLYGAEQSGWHDIADEQDMIVVYPAPARGKIWNVYDLPDLPSDFSFVLALLEHMKNTYAIDESRVYLSGFSMGGMLTHALAAAYPERFAAAAPCNGLAFDRFKDPAEALGMFLREMTPEQIGHVSYSVPLADKKKRDHPDLRMPLILNMGMQDAQMGFWPVADGTDDVRTRTLAWWKEYNHIADGKVFDSDTPTGLAAGEGGYLDDHHRYYCQSWYTEDTHLPLLKLVAADRMPHAVDPVQIRWVWDFLRHFSRRADGTLQYER